VKKLLYIAILLCTSLPKLYSQSYIKSIEHGVYTDHNFVYPYTQVGATVLNGLYFELGMLDLPTEINMNFNSTIQTRAGRLAYLINNVEEPVSYRGPQRNKELYYSVGLATQYKDYRQILQVGISYGEFMVKTSNYFRVIDVTNAYLDLGVHLQYGERRQFLFIGYSYGLDFDPK